MLGSSVILDYSSFTKQLVDSLDTAELFLREKGNKSDEEAQNACRLTRFALRHFKEIQTYLNTEKYKNFRDKMWNLILDFPFENLLSYNSSTQRECLLGMTSLVVKRNLDYIRRTVSELDDLVKSKEITREVDLEKIRLGCRVSSLFVAHRHFLKRDENIDHRLKNIKKHIQTQSPRPKSLGALAEIFIQYRTNKRGLKEEAANLLIKDAADDQHYSGKYGIPAIKEDEDLITEDTDEWTLIDTHEEREESIIPIDILEETEEPIIKIHRQENPLVVVGAFDPSKNTLAMNFVKKIMDGFLQGVVQIFRKQEFQSALAQSWIEKSVHCSADFQSFLQAFLPQFFKNHFPFFLTHIEALLHEILTNEKISKDTDEWLLCSLLPRYLSEENTLSPISEELILSLLRPKVSETPTKESEPETTQSAKEEQTIAKEVENSVKQEQTKIIEDFLSSTIRHYAPTLIEAGAKVFIDALQDDYIRSQFSTALAQVFSDLIPKSLGNTEKLMNTLVFVLIEKHSTNLVNEIAKALLESLGNEAIREAFIKWILTIAVPGFFTKPKGLNEKKKAIVLSFLSGLQQFFVDFNQSLSTVGEMSNLAPEDKDADAFETQIIALMNAQMRKKKGSVVLTKDSEETYSNLYREVRSLLGAYITPAKTPEGQQRQDLLMVTLSIFLRRIVDGLFSPDAFAVIIDKLMEDPLSFEAPDEPPPPRTEDTKDSVFTIHLRDSVKRLVTVVASVGSKNVSAFLMKNTISLILSFFNKKIDILEEQLNNMAMSKCTIKPPFLGKQLLFTKEGEPALLDCFSKDPVEIRKIKAKIKATVDQNKLYEQIKTSIDPKYSTVLSYAKGMINSYPKYGYIFMQRKLLLMMLFTYVENYMKNWRNYLPKK